MSDGIVVHNTTPKHTIWAKRLRAGYGVPKGYSMVNWDYSQGELRIIACIANETNMIKAYRKDIDLHIKTGAELNGILYKDALKLKEIGDKKIKVIRQGGKAGNFGLIFGISPAGFVEYARNTYGVELTLEEATKQKDAFFDMYPEIATYHEINKAHAHKYGYVVSPLGRVRHLPLINCGNWAKEAQAERQSINCVDAKTECLTLDGWKNYKQLSVGDLIWVRGENHTLVLEPIDKLNIYPDYEGEVYLWDRAGFSALTTSNHNWLIERRGRKNKSFGLVTSKNLKQEPGMNIVTSAPTGTKKANYSDNFLRLIAWAMTDGSYATTKSTVLLFQSENKYAQKIRDLLDTQGSWTEHCNGKHRPEQRVFTLPLHKARAIRSMFPNRVLTASFISKLSSDQAKVMIDTMIDADGTRGNDKTEFYSVTQERTDAFQYLCTIAGIPTVSRIKVGYTNKKVYSSIGYKIKSKDSLIVHLCRSNRVHAQYGKSKIDNYKGLMWCPTVKSGTFIMRRNGKTTITGNSPVQGTLSDISCLALAEHKKTHNNPESCRFFAMTHDALTAYVKTDELDYWIPETQRIMENLPLADYFGWEPQLSFKTDVEIGTNFGNMAEVANVNDLSAYMM